jgi:hypothetical protein
VKKLKLKMSQSSTNWTTAAGGVKTNSKCKSQFCIPELEDKMLLEYNLHVADNLVGSPDILQEKVFTLMEGLKFVHTYINDLLVLSKGSFEDHLLKLKLMLKCLQKA